MAYSIYNKPFKDATALISDLKSKQLTIHNESEAENFLKNVNYYRFKIYLRPFLDLSTKTYLPSSSFESALKLYRFDDFLRDQLFSIIGRIEIKLRSKLDQTITNYTNDPFWYLNQTYFQRNNNYHVLSDLSNKFLSSKEEFIVHYKDNYFNDKNNDYKHMPPFWFISELTTFGNILTIYKGLNKDKFIVPGGNLLDNLANEFGAYNLKELNNWLKVLKEVRNKCAHHSRVWNANYSAPSGLDHKLTIPQSNKNRIYSTFVLLEIMTKNLNINDIDIKNFILDLMSNCKTFESKMHTAGFPNNWDTDPFWN